jgi:two-component sensor histidine kinase
MMDELSKSQEDLFEVSKLAIEIDNYRIWETLEVIINNFNQETRKIISQTKDEIETEMDSRVRDLNQLLNE